MTNNDVWSLESRKVRSHHDMTYPFLLIREKKYVISRCDLTFLLSKLHTSLFVIFFHPNILPKNIWHFVTKERKKCSTGQLISKCLFGVFTIFQKTDKNKSKSSKVEFVCSFFGRNVSLKKNHFKFVWPLYEVKFSSEEFKFTKLTFQKSSQISCLLTPFWECKVQVF